MVQRLVVWWVVGVAVAIGLTAAWSMVEIARMGVDAGQRQAHTCVWDCIGQGYADGRMSGGECACRGEVEALCDEDAQEERRRAQAMGISR